MTRLDEMFADLPKRLTVAEVAEMLRMTTKGVHQWIHQGVVPAYKMGNTVMVLRDELRDSLEAGRIKPREAEGSDE